MPTFLTVKEAAMQTRKSPSSIRRIIYPIIADERHADRPHIRPTVEEVQTLRMKGENFAWRISDELLKREVPPEESGGANAAKLSDRGASDATIALIVMLERELAIKNQQIAQQSEMINKQMQLLIP